MASGLAFASCEKMLDTDQSRVLFAEDNTLSSPNDSLYSAVGILKDLQGVASQYVLLDVRADLSQPTSNADTKIKALADFDFSDETYTSARAYYKVINDCNFYIAHRDTTLKEAGLNITTSEMAAVKSVRAWAYLQLATNYGQVPFITEPLTSISASLVDYPKKGIEEMAQYMIADLAPYADVTLPSWSLNGFSATYLFPPVRLVIADYYLWTGQYEQAAQYYYDYLTDTHTYAYSNTCMAKANGEYMMGTWASQFSTSDSEMKFYIPMTYTDTEGNTIELADIADVFSTCQSERQIAPSDGYIALCDSQVFFNGSREIRGVGDLRRYATFTTTTRDGEEFVLNSKFSSSLNYNSALSSYNLSQPSIVGLYRAGLIWLRMAEAANRAGYPSFAFAILKWGVNQNICTQGYGYIDDSELADAQPWMNFAPKSSTATDWFSYSIGVHSRGLGSGVEKSTDYPSFAIPECATKSDSIDAVEDLIVNELAMETAFEGNRYTDLLRIGLHRSQNDYAARKVAMRGGSFDESLYQKALANKYLPLK